MSQDHGLVWYGCDAVIACVDAYICWWYAHSERHQSGSHPWVVSGLFSAHVRNDPPFVRIHPVQLATYVTTAVPTSWTNAYGPSLTRVPAAQPLTPAARRAPRSHSTVSTPKKTRK